MTEALRSSAKLAGGPSTRSVHAGSRRLKANHALVDPIYQTSTFTFESMADAQAYQTDHMFGLPTDRFEYGRYGNPTIAAAEARLAALENADGAILVSSGMAAITQTLLHFLPQGSHVATTIASIIPTTDMTHCTTDAVTDAITEAGKVRNKTNTP